MSRHSEPDWEYEFVEIATQLVTEDETGQFMGPDDLARAAVAEPQVHWDMLGQALEEHQALTKPRRLSPDKCLSLAYGCIGFLLGMAVTCLVYVLVVWRTA